MSTKDLKVTETRLLWLRKLDAMNERVGYFVRDGGVTRHTLSGRRMPEPIYMWLVEHHLIDVDCGNIQFTAKGQSLLNKILRSDAQAYTPDPEKSIESCTATTGNP